MSVDQAQQTTRKNIRVYVCPTPECSNFYGCSTMPNLYNEFTGPKTEDKHALEKATGHNVRHTRAECPECRVMRKDSDGKPLQVERILLMVPINVPIAGPPTPPLPPSSDLSRGKQGS